MYSLKILPDIIVDKIRTYVIFTPIEYSELKKAVDLLYFNNKLACKLYGHISLWNIRYITDMSGLFAGNFNFNSVISSWMLVM